MPLINCEVDLILIFSSTCVITNSVGVGKFEVFDAKLYVPVVNLSTQNNTKLLQQLKSGFRRTIIGPNINQIQKHKHKTNI